MLSELRQPPAFRPRLVPSVRHYLNTLPRKLLKGCAPIELAFGIKAESPLTFAINMTSKLKRPSVLSPTRQTSRSDCKTCNVCYPAT
jgi:hypothetical protein